MPPEDSDTESVRETPSGSSGRRSKINTAVAAYKTILRHVLDTRPSGTRGRLARTLGKNSSFISHITNPAYTTPIPARHVEEILDLCHFPDQDRRAFIDAYERAHPGRLRPVVEGDRLRSRTILLPDLENAAQNTELDRMVDDFVARISRFAKSFEPTGTSKSRDDEQNEETD